MSQFYVTIPVGRFSSLRIYKCATPISQSAASVFCHARLVPALFNSRFCPQFCEMAARFNELLPGRPTFDNIKKGCAKVRALICFNCSFFTFALRFTGFIDYGLYLYSVISLIINCTFAHIRFTFSETPAFIGNLEIRLY
jgi:hypothetical protein